MKKFFFVTLFVVFLLNSANSNQLADSLVYKINDSISSLIVIKPDGQHESYLLKNNHVVEIKKYMPNSVKLSIMGITLLFLASLYPFIGNKKKR